MIEYKSGYTEIKVSHLVMCDWNYKYIDTDDAEESMIMDKLEANFKRNGQVENIIVRQLDTGFYEVVNGNHRYKVAKRMGLEVLMCFNLGVVSQPEAIRVAIETNETKFKTDQLKLAERLKELQDEFDYGELKETMPYEDNDFDNFNKLLSFDWEDFDGADPKSDSHGEGEKDFKTLRYELPIQVAEQLEEQVNRFKKILYPDQKPMDVSNILPIEAMCQALSQVDDKNIVGDMS